MYRWAKEDMSSIIRLADGACIPCAVGNKDFYEFEAWRAAGNTPEEAYQPSLASVKAALTARVDYQAGEQRRAIVTVIPAQDLVYVNNWQEAIAALAMQSPPAALFPWLSALVGTIVPDTGNETTDIHAAANLVMSKRNEWSAAGAEIERKRHSAKLAIAAAATVAEAEAAARVEW